MTGDGGMQGRAHGLSLRGARSGGSSCPSRRRCQRSTAPGVRYAENRMAAPRMSMAGVHGLLGCSSELRQQRAQSLWVDRLRHEPIRP